MNDIILDQFELNEVNFINNFVVKIAGKGNIIKTDERYMPLFVCKWVVYDLINNMISDNNIHNKPVVIIWDGDNYQDNDHEKPSPFTHLIYELSKIKNYHMCALKYKKDTENPWKQKHINSWNGIKFHKLYNYIEPHILSNKMCNMYVSYGSANFQYKDDDPSKGETSGYAQLKEFKANNNLKTLKVDKQTGFEVYLKL